LCQCRGIAEERRLHDGNECASHRYLHFPSVRAVALTDRDIGDRRIARSILASPVLAPPPTARLKIDSGCAGTIKLPFSKLNCFLWK
jgi:hypothetical protein